MEDQPSSSWPSPTLLITTGILLLALPEIYTIIHRLYFSPIAHFPGPRLAAVTLWWQFYFDVIKPGKLLWEIERLHLVYGPVVRIGPNELHVWDADFYDVLFTSAKRRDKNAFVIQGFGAPQSAFATEPHEHHKLRRAALNPYFSKAAVTKLEPLIVSKVDLLCRRLLEFQARGEVVELEAAFNALTTDVVTEYCFAKGHGFLEKEGFEPAWAKAILGSSKGSNFGRYCPGFIEFTKSWPLWAVKGMDADIGRIVEFGLTHQRQVEAIASGQYVEEKGNLAHRTIIHELLSNPALPAHEKTVTRIAEEAQILVAAGAVTTTHFLQTCLFFILSNPAILARLKAELETAMPDSSALPPCYELEQLPYLAAVMEETGRMTSGVSARLARVAHEDLRLYDWVIPAGTTVAMTQPLQHMNGAVFAEPTRFCPERWLRGGESVKLERYLVNFGKGTRACVGINLAKAELCLCLAAVVRRFDFELWETERERDVDMKHDWFVPQAEVGTKGVRVVVRGSVEF